MAFGIIGKILVGKGIEWLVPAFQNNAALDKLTVAGEFYMPQNHEPLSVLSGYDGFINRFMSESDMLERALSRIKGMAEFRQAHSVKSLRGRVIQELLG